MDFLCISNLLSRNMPFRIETSSGRIFDVPHRDFVGFSLKRTTMHIGYLEHDEERFAMVPLHTITAATIKEASES